MDYTKYSDLQNDVLIFLDYPWQEDAEIEFIELVEENRDKILAARDPIIQAYLRQLYQANESHLINRVSEFFDGMIVRLFGGLVIYGDEKSN